MANRTFMDQSFTLIKREVRLYADVTSSEAVTPIVTLQRWNYPTLGTGTAGIVRTYTAAPGATAIPSGTGPYPLQYTAGSEGFFSVTRTAAGKWTVVLQDAYQRLLMVNAMQSNSGGVATFVTCNEDTAITSMATTPGSTIGLKFSSAAGAAVDPIGTVRLQFILGDATEP